MIVNGIEETQYRLTLTGLYMSLHGEHATKRLIRRWRAGTGVDNPVKENIVKKILRCWHKKPVQKRGEIRCILYRDTDMMVYTAHFNG